MDEGKLLRRQKATDLPEMLETWPISLCSSDETHGNSSDSSTLEAVTGPAHSTPCTHSFLW